MQKRAFYKAAPNDPCRKMSALYQARRSTPAYAHRNVMKRPTLPLNLLCSSLLLSLTSMLVPGQNASYRPGTTDPAGNPRNLTLFRDEQIYSVGLPSAAGAPWRAATVDFDGT